MNDVIILSDSDESEFEEVPSKKLKTVDKKVTTIDENQSRKTIDEVVVKSKVQGNSINIDLNDDKMVVTIKKNGEELFSDSKVLTHVIEDAEMESDLAGKSNTIQEVSINKEDKSENNLQKFETIILASSSENTLINENVQLDIEAFIVQCENMISDKLKTTFAPKAKSLRLLTKKAIAYISTDEFKTFLKENLDQMISMPKDVVECFANVYNEVQAAAYNKSLEAQTTSKEDRLIKMLENALREIHRKIRKLEIQEVNFDEENDSSYIQYSRYKERAAKLYDRYCKILKLDPLAGQITHNRLDFGKSKHTEFNKALNKKYKNNKRFPTYADVDKVIRGCIKDNDMNLSENEINLEVRTCFEELGNLMQKRRQMELHIIHSSFFSNQQVRDPADTDKELRIKLEMNKTQAQKKLNELCQDFVEKQEKGVEVIVSEDSDDSNHEISEDD